MVPTAGADGQLVEYEIKYLFGVHPLLSGVGDYPEYTGRGGPRGRIRLEFGRSRVLNTAEVLQIVSARGR